MTTPVTQPAEDEILRTDEVSRILKVPVGTLRWWRYQGLGPRSFKLGPRIVAYKRSDVEAWIQTGYAAAARTT